MIEERRGGKKEPYATKSPLGWTLIGPTSRQKGSPKFKVNFTRPNDDQLMEQVERFWKTEAGGSALDEDFGYSIEDKRAKTIMDKSVTMVNGHYQLGLPWKYADPILPENRKVWRSLGYST